MSGWTATWRLPVHSIFVLTVNERVGRLSSDQVQEMRTRELYTTRAVATQHCRVRKRRSFPGKRVSTHGPASYHSLIRRRFAADLRLGRGHRLLLVYDAMGRAPAAAPRGGGGARRSASGLWSLRSASGTHST
eukprot:4295564-Prymnesium_polylepis.1